jgi:hypothetical protein
MSNNPTSEKLTFLELIEKFKIEIPIIQRDYAQGREGKEGLRKNFLGALLDAVKGKELELDFVYGSVKDNVLQPLDGQQRLTTLFLLHWFVAVKENKLDDELKKLLIKFTYETRTSSREFCNELINKGIIYKPEQKISEQIIDSPWFFLSWKKDPTIKSMLTMLDDIQQTFKNETEIWEKLNNISFHFIELQNFGLSDDLYIKMNARGKALTDFENFKAKFEQYIKQNNWENSENPTETFSHKIDTVWTDLFWKYRDESENVFDEKILNFFRTMAVINYTLKADIKDDKFSDNIDLLRGDQKVSFNQYLDLGCFDEVYFETIKSVLDKISDKNGLKKFLDDTSCLDEEKIFNGMIQKNSSYPDLVIAFAYYQYLASEENIEKENLKSWLRIIRNLVEGSRPYLFNNANEFANAMRSVKNLFQHKNSIVKYFAETEKISLSGFIGEQVSEEKLKAKLITQSNDWKDVILEIENHGYFKGQIGFLLDWCKNENGVHNIEKFREFGEKAKAVFTKDGLNNNFGNYLFERALLATGDYLLTKGKNHSFLIDNDRDISWKRLLRDDNDKRKILKSLFDNIKAATLKEDLEKIVDDFSDKNDWRYYFIKQPEMIAACGSQKLIRWNSELDILLLGSTTTSGYHKEYYSYSLFVELKEKLSLNENLYKYKDQRSVDDWKYFELNGKKIAFDCNTGIYLDRKTGRYFWTQDDKWSTKTVFESREKAILELTKGNL